MPTGDFSLGSALLSAGIPNRPVFLYLNSTTTKKASSIDVYRPGNPEEKCASVISGLLFAAVERRMTGEGSSSAHEPCTELARVTALGLATPWGVEGRQQRLALGSGADF